MFDQSGRLPRIVKIYRLPDASTRRSILFSTRVHLDNDADNPIYIRLTQEDETRAWTSPLYVFQ